MLTALHKAFVETPRPGWRRRQPGSNTDKFLVRTAQPADRPSPVRWTAWQEKEARHRLRNDSTESGASALLIGFEDVTPGGGDDAAYPGNLPVKLAGGESVPFILERSIDGPAVTSIKLTWIDPDGVQRRHTLNI